MKLSLQERILTTQQASNKITELAEEDRQASQYLRDKVTEYVAFVERLAEGDLTARLEIKSEPNHSSHQAEKQSHPVNGEAQEKR